AAHPALLDPRGERVSIGEGFGQLREEVDDVADVLGAALIGPSAGRRVDDEQMIERARFGRGELAGDLDADLSPEAVTEERAYRPAHGDVFRRRGDVARGRLERVRRSEAS